MKMKTRTSRKLGRNRHKPAGHKLWRKVLKHKYGHLWREYVEIG